MSEHTESNTVSDMPSVTSAIAIPIIPARGNLFRGCAHFC